MTSEELAAWRRGLKDALEIVRSRRKHLVIYVCNCSAPFGERHAVGCRAEWISVHPSVPVILSEVELLIAGAMTKEPTP